MIHEDRLKFGDRAEIANNLNGYKDKRGVITGFQDNHVPPMDELQGSDRNVFFWSRGGSRRLYLLNLM